MNLSAHVDIYCERLDASFWAEPINAITNISFILAALWAFQTYNSERLTAANKNHDPLVLVAIFMGGLIGIGSFLFHTFATVWSSLADVIPIWTFVAYFIFLAIYRIAGTSLAKAFRIYGISIIVTFAVLWLVSDVLLASDSASAEGDGFNGSTQYLPGMIALYVFALIMVIRRHVARFWILAAAMTFTLSIYFRTIDLDVCSDFALGTHFLWHSLTGSSLACSCKRL